MSKGPKVGEKKKFNLPHVCIILFAIMIICAIATYIIPAGSYDYVENDMGRNVAVPGSWHPVDDAKPVGPFRLFELVYEGMVNAADISFLVFITYCSVTFIIKSGAFEGAVGALLDKNEQDDRDQATVMEKVADKSFDIQFFIVVGNFHTLCGQEVADQEEDKCC